MATNKNQKHVLVVEDEKPIATALRLKLTKEGLESTVVETGAEAVNVLKNKEFDVMLLDLMIPTPDGFSILEMLGNSEESLKKPGRIAVTTNLSQPEDRDRAMQLGADDFFVKSDVSLSDLVAWVKAN